MLLNWLRRPAAVSIPPPPAPAEDVAPARTSRPVRIAPKVLCLLGPTKEVEATSWFLAGSLADDYTFVIGSSERLVFDMVKRYFGLSTASETPDMFLGVSGDQLAATIRGAIDANFQGLWARNLEKIRDRMTPDVFIVTASIVDEIEWCRDVGASFLATPGYDGDDETHLQLTTIDEDAVVMALERLAKDTTGETVTRKVRVSPAPEVAK